MVNEYLMFNLLFKFNYVICFLFDLFYFFDYFDPSFISGITLLGLPTEVYSYGIQYVYVAGGVVLMGLAMGFVYLPVFHNLNITSTYEVSFKSKTILPTVMHTFLETPVALLAESSHRYSIYLSMETRFELVKTTPVFSQLVQYFFSASN